MQTEDALSLLRELAVNDGLEYTFRLSERIAFVDICEPGATAPAAQVSTPGDLWFRLTVAGGFLLIDTTDEPPDEEVKDNLETYLQIARDYIAQRPTPQGRRFPKLRIRSAGREYVLERSVAYNLLAMITRRGPAW